MLGIGTVCLITWLWCSCECVLPHNTVIKEVTLYKVRKICIKLGTKCNDEQQRATLTHDWSAVQKHLLYELHGCVQAAGYCGATRPCCQFVQVVTCGIATKKKNPVAPQTSIIWLATIFELSIHPWQAQEALLVCFSTCESPESADLCLYLRLTLLMACLACTCTRGCWVTTCWGDITSLNNQ